MGARDFQISHQSTCLIAPLLPNFSRLMFEVLAAKDLIMPNWVAPLAPS